MIVIEFLLLLVFFRDLLFRFFFIYPITNLNGHFARKIEDVDIVKWVSSVLKTTEVQVGIVGNSHVMDAIDPEIISKITNKTCFNLALYYIPLPNMVEILHKKKYFPKTIIMDFSTRYSMYNEDYFFYENLLGRHYNNKRDVLFDRISSIAPSFFIPIRFLPISSRAIQKIKQWKREKFPSIGRYTPFNRLVGFYWKLNKRSNHRFVLREREKSKMEKLLELKTLKKSISETAVCCNTNSLNYFRGLQIIESYVSTAKQMGLEIIFIRLPMHKYMIFHENKNFNFYFQDVEKIALKFNIPFIDFSSDVISRQLQPYLFYIDGQHLEHTSAIEISKFLAKQINKQ